MVFGHKERNSEACLFSLLIIVSPWLIYVLDEVTQAQPSLIGSLKKTAVPLGFNTEPTHIFLGWLTLLIFTGMSMLIGMYIIFFSIPSLALFYGIKVVNSVSKHLQLLSREKIHMAFSFIYVAVPIYFFVKGQFS